MKSFIRKKIIIGKKAFSLIELSVAIVVLSIVVAGMLSVSTNAVINDKTKKSKDNIDLIYSALGTYLLKNGAMPCPAPITSARSTDVNYGYATGSSGICADQDGVYSHQNSVYGMVPVKNLGLASDVAEDGFGNKFGYLIYKDFTSSSFGTASSNARGIDIKNNTTSLVASTELAMFAIISYGANKYGAFNANSGSQNSASTLAAEQANYPTNLTDESVNTAAFSTSTTDKITINASSATTSSVFDDIVFFKTRNDMVRDFNALFLIKCPVVPDSAGANSVTFGGTYFAWSNGAGTYGGEYGEAATSSTECPTGWKTTVKWPTRRCGAFGQWEAGGTNPTNIAAPCTQ